MITLNIVFEPFDEILDVQFGQDNEYDIKMSEDLETFPVEMEV